MQLSLIVSGYGIEFDGWPNWPMDFLHIAGGIINPPTGDPFSAREISPKIDRKV